MNWTTLTFSKGIAVALSLLFWLGLAINDRLERAATAEQEESFS